MYDVFISYRQLEPDRTVAQVLQRRLEGFRTPRTLMKAGVPPRLQRVFLDRSELAASPDLEHELVAALEQSRFLVVVCSPRTPESKWIAREVELFRAQHGAERILLLLIEGEPNQSYPEALRGGPGHAEPLAADMRASTLAQALKRLRRQESLRLLAPVLGVSFDALWQRERRRRQQRLGLGLVLGTALAAGALGLVLNARQQATARETVTTLGRLTDNALRLARQGERGLAAQLALQAFHLDEGNRYGQRESVLTALRAAVAAPGFNLTLTTSAVPPNAMALSSDGQLLALGHADGSLMWLELAPGAKVRAQRPADDRAVQALAFVPGTRVLMVGLEDGEVQRVVLTDGGPQVQARARCSGVMALAVHPAGQWLAAASPSRGLCVLDTALAQAAQQRPLPGAVRSLAFSADGRWLAAALRGAVALFATDDHTLSPTPAQLPLPGETATAVAFGPQHLLAASHAHLGEQLQQSLQAAAAGGGESANTSESNAVLRLWSLQSLGSPPQVVPLATPRVQALAAQAGGTRVAVAGSNGQLWLVDSAAPQGPVRALIGHTRAAVALAFAARGERLLSASVDKTLRLWRVNDPPDGELPAEANALALAFFGTQHLAAALKFNHAPTVWHLRTGRSLSQPEPAPRGVVLSLAADAGAETAAGGDGRFDRLAFATGPELAGAVEHGVRVWRWAAPASSSAAPGPAQAQSQSQTLALGQQFQPGVALQRLAFGAGGRWLAGTSEDTDALVLMDTRKGSRQSLPLPTAARPVLALALHPAVDPPQVAVGTPGGLVVLQAAADGMRVVNTVPAQTPASGLSAVADLTYSRDGQWLATTGADGALRLWRTAAWNEPPLVLRTAGSEGAVPLQRVAENPATGELATGDQNGAVRLWPAPGGLRKAAPTALLLRAGGGTSVRALAFSPDGQVLAVALPDAHIALYSSLAALLTQGCQDLQARPANATALTAEWVTYGSARLPPIEPC